MFSTKYLNVSAGIKVLRTIFIYCIGILFFLLLTLSSKAAVITWDGGGADNNWSTAANWSTDTVPGSGDTVTFDGTSVKNAVIDASFPGNVSAFNINSGYTGTVTLDAGVSLNLSGSFSMNAGIFAASTGSLDINGDFTLSGGTFNLPSGGLNLQGAWTHTAGGTFNNNNSTVQFDGTVGKLLDCNSSLATSCEFYNVSINAGNDSGGITVQIDDIMKVSGTLSLLNGNLAANSANSKIQSSGNVTVTSTFDTLSIQIEFIGSSDQNFDLSGATSLYDGNITINKSGGTLTLMSDLIMDAAGQDFTLLNGSFDIGSNALMVQDQFIVSGGSFLSAAGSLDINGDFTLSGGTFNLPSGGLNLQGAWTHTAGGTFNNNNSTVQFDGTVGKLLDCNSSLATSCEFYNVSINAGNDSGGITVQIDDIMKVSGTLSLLNGNLAANSANSKIQSSGNVTVTSTFDTLSIQIEFIGSSDQNFDLSGATSLYDGNITINKSGGTLTLMSDLIMDNTGQDLNLSNGSFDLNGNNLSVNGSSGQFNVSNNGILRLQGNESIVANSNFPALAVGSTVLYYGTGGPYTLLNLDYDNLQFDGLGGVWQASQSLNIPGNLTITNGTLSLLGNTLSVTGTFNNLGTLRLVGTEVLNITHDSDSGTYEYVGNGDGNADVFPLYDVTHNNILVNMSDSADTLSYSGTRPEDTLTNNLWLWWKLDDASGSANAADSSGNSRSGTLNNTNNTSVWVAGSNSIQFANTGAISLDGVDDYVEFTSDTGFPDRSVSLWFRATDVNSRQVIFEEGGANNGLNIYIDGGKLYAGAWGLSITDQFLVSTGNISTNTWYNVIIIYDSDGNFELILDGVTQGTGAPGGDMADHSAQDAIGAMIGDTKFHDASGGSGNGNFFAGEIDDFRIYSRTLNSNEVLGLSEGYDTAQATVSISALNLNGDFTLNNGTFSAPSTMNVGGNWSNSGGSFVNNNGTVNFNNAGAIGTISGNSNFYNFSVTTAGKTLNFTSGSTQSIAGMFTATGVSGNQVILRGTSLGISWYLNANTSSVDYVDVKDSNASGGNTITHAVDVSRSTDSGGNTNWGFNDPPSATNVTAVQSQTGDGDVLISFIMDDPDDDDTLQAKIEYSLDGGLSWSDPTLSTVDSEVTANIAGDPNIDNAQNYQVGQIGAYILSSSGPNTVQIVWESADDIPANTDISNAQIRVTPYDGSSEGNSAQSSSFALDFVAPDGLGEIDQNGFTNTEITIVWQSAPSDNNFSHYEIWYGTDQSDVEGRSGSAKKWDNGNDAALSSANTLSSTINFVNEQRSYFYYRLYAFDDGGNVSASNTIFIAGGSASSSSYAASGGTGSSGASESSITTSATNIEEDENDEVDDQVESTQSNEGQNEENNADEEDKISNEEDEESENGIEEQTQDSSPSWQDYVVPVHWSSGYIKYLEESTNMIDLAISTPTFTDILEGIYIYPDKGMLRGEATEFLMTMAGYNIENTSFNVRELAFSDVDENNKLVGFIQKAYELGLVNGYPNGTFQPERIVNRAEALKLASYFFGIDIDSDLRGTDLLKSYGYNSSPFEDVDLNAWYAPYVVHAYYYGVIKGYEDGTFKPNNNVTYAEFLKIATLFQNLNDAVSLASELES